MLHLKAAAILLHLSILPLSCSLPNPIRRCWTEHYNVNSFFKEIPSVEDFEECEREAELETKEGRHVKSAAYKPG